MNQRNLTFWIFLSIIVTYCNGNFTGDVGFSSELLPVKNSMIISEYSNFESGKVNINNIFDEILPKIRDFLVKRGMEPVNLPNYIGNVINFSGIFNGKINLRNGFLHYITNVKRSKNIMVQYNYKRLLVDVSLRWQLLNFNYDYDLIYLFMKKRGEVYGLIDDTDFDVSFEIDLNKYEMIFHGIRIHRINSFSMTVHSNKLDPVMNILTSVITRFFQNRIIKLLEEESIKTLRVFIDEMNKRIKKTNYEVKNLIGSF
ncbi:uncharacterized protein LOC124955765 [Vespa velutina]|uniref:uncharacterized protein LOC124955765 n=1 Tax=Vespa velutina TaxID=202808 RepID=UPI001FB3DA91|nr:uncharacterized protein LOC124955765 [Vespa velutina]